jgi:hypothetical protein
VFESIFLQLFNPPGDQIEPMAQTYETPTQFFAQREQHERAGAVWQGT